MATRHRTCAQTPFQHIAACNVPQLACIRFNRLSTSGCFLGKRNDDACGTAATQLLAVVGVPALTAVAALSSMCWGMCYLTHLGGCPSSSLHTPQGPTPETCNELAPTLRASALFLGRPLLADAWMRAVNASGLGSSPVSYTAFLSVQWALNPNSCQITQNRIFRTYTPLAAPRPASNSTQCCNFCKVPRN